MKQTMKKVMGTFIAVGLIVMNMAGTTAFATTDTGAAGALTHSDYTLEEMLIYAIEDEYLAQAEYEVIMDTFDVTRPFSNILKAEGTHIRLLTPLFEGYHVEVPTKDWESLVAVPKTLEETFAIGVEAEIKNINMYENFLQQELPADVQAVFERLQAASEKHLAAFQRQVDNQTAGLGNGGRNGAGGQRGRSSNGFGGNGQGSRVINQASRLSLTEDCLLPSSS